VYAKVAGSVAAPTAGLHFTEELFQKIKDKGAQMTEITLHVGLGTFEPIREDDYREHKMYTERFSVSSESANVLNKAKEEGRRIIAVGTTTARVLESIFNSIHSNPSGGISSSCRSGHSFKIQSVDPESKGKILNSAFAQLRSGRQVQNDSSCKFRCGSGSTSIFIYPGYEFQAIDALITNFHLPKSSLLLLVSAFAGKDLTLRAYREAIEKGYRFYSYGDGMFIF